jgi:hypothetical protein
MKRRWLILVLLACAGCAGPGSESTDFDDAGTTDLDAQARPAETGASHADAKAPLFATDAAPASQCERSLSVGALSISQSTCFINQHVENLTTTLLFPCAGGHATATFSGHAFTGTVAGDAILLQDVEPFPFNGCEWQSTEVIQGDLASGSLTYTYSEHPVVSCPETPCTASGALAVSAGDVTVVK